MQATVVVEKKLSEKPRLSKIVDQFILKVSGWLAWLSVVLVATIMIQVTMRYVFGKGNVMLEEMQWHIYGVMIIMAISYGVVADNHIRVDVISARFSPRTKAYIEFFGILFLLLPMIWVVFDNSLDLVHDSWRVNESSEAPTGLPYRWAFKSFLCIGMGLFAISALSRLLYMGKIIFGRQQDESKNAEEILMSSKNEGKP